MQKLWRGAAYWLAFLCLLSMLSYGSQLGPPPSFPNWENALQLKSHGGGPSTEASFSLMTLAYITLKQNQPVEWWMWESPVCCEQYCSWTGGPGLSSHGEQACQQHSPMTSVSVSASRFLYLAPTLNSLMMDCKLRSEINLFMPKLFLVMVFITVIETKIGWVFTTL